MADPVLIIWSIENIIKNSLEASEYQKSIIDINIYKINKILNIDFVDNGKGISKNNWKKIFDPGFTSKQRGWGLGLSLTRRIIQDLHKGKIYVVKSNSVGTLIRLQLKIN